jgi:WD40 repeat protein
MSPTLLLLACLQADPEPVLRTSEPGALIRSLSWSRQGLVAACRSGDLMYVAVRDPDANGVLHRSAARPSDWGTVSGPVAVFAPRLGPLEILDLAEGRRRTWDPGSTSLWLALSPDGSRLARRNPEATTLHHLTGDDRPVALESARSPASIHFSPDGTKVAALESPEGLGVWDTGTGRRLLTLEAPFWCTDRLAFSPDGALLLCAGSDRRVQVWRLSDGTLQTSASLDSSRPIISRDGRFVAVAGADRRIHRLTLPRLAPAGILGRAESSIICLAYSPDGTRVASGHANGDLLIWKAGAP